MRLGRARQVLFYQQKFVIVSTSTASFVFLWMLCCVTLVSAQEKATLTGVITDEITLEPLSGASIVLKGTGLGTAADAKGNYTIQNIEAGTYLVQVSLVGYTKVQRTGVVIRAGETLRLDFRLKESSVSSEAVTIIGERPMMDFEQTTSSSTLSPELIALAPLKDVRELAATQIGVVKTPDGLHLRGGRSYETGFYIDGISVRDPLAGTGFGLDLTPEAFADLEIITGGAGAEFGESSAGVVKVKTKEGGDVYHSTLTLRRDNLFFDTPVGWNTSRYAATASGPVPFKKVFPFLSGDVYFFAALSLNFTDEFYKTPAQQLRPTEFSTFFAPANDNKWDGIFKLTYKLSGTDKFTLLFTRSLVINQNAQSLQITGNDLQLQPGYQFAFALIPDSGNVYTHDTNVEALQWTHVFSRQTVLSLQATRFFTQLRAEVGGLPWRPGVLEADFDPRSVVTNPQYVNPNDTIVYAAAPSGLYSKGVAPLWHDHYAEDYGVKADLLYNTEDESQRFLFGLDAKFSEYQWIDLTRPWIGAPYAAGEPSRRLGIAPDIWRVNAAQGAVYVSDNVRLGDFFATAGVRVQYWLPGSFLDDAVADPNSLVPPGFREPYLKNTSNIFGRRVSFRVLPKISMSFPLAPAQTFFFNYGQSSMLPHPRFLYAGLDARYSDDSTTARIGNPSLRPEITTAYELGFRGQFSENDVVTLTGFYKDVKDLIVSAKLDYT
ncbi:MAG: TonB-dependent receptor, partial [Rhizobacter sp.]|nr:TonB-dependent receptor [Chlorobiales bacterium]